MENSEQNYTLIQNIFCLAPSKTNAYISAYTFRYKSLFQKSFRAIQRAKHLPTKSIYFYSWRETTRAYESYKRAIYARHYYRSLQFRFLRFWKFWMMYKQTKRKYYMRAAQTRKGWLLKSAFTGLKRAVIIREKYTKFMIKRYRTLLTKLISHWRSLRLCNDKLSYSKYKARSFNGYILKTRVFYSWKNQLAIDRRLRKMHLFFKYWRKSIRKTLEDYERFAIGCRKRFLKSVYFTRLKTAVHKIKTYRKACKQHSKALFTRWRKMVLLNRIKRAKNSLALQYCFNYSFRNLKAKYFHKLLVFKAIKATDRARKEKEFKHYLSYTRTRLLRTTLVGWQQSILVFYIQINRVSGQKHNKMKVKVFFALKKLYKNMLVKSTFASTYRKLELKKKSFKIFQIHCLPKIIRKRRAKRISRLFLIEKGFKGFKKYLYMNQNRPMSEYYVLSLFNKAIVSFRLHMFEASRKRERTARLKWFSFDRNHIKIFKCFTYWKIIHRIKLVLSAIAYETTYLAISRWKCNSKLMRLL